MNNKVLVKIIVPGCTESFDVYIPVNEVMWKVNRMITKSIFDLFGLPFDAKKDVFIFANKDSGQVYNHNEVVIKTNIRNSTELVMLPMPFRLE